MPRKPPSVKEPSYAFCESSAAGSLAPWHIRKLNGTTKKLSGGIDSESLDTSRPGSVVGTLKFRLRAILSITLLTAAVTFVKNARTSIVKSTQLLARSAIASSLSRTLRAPL